MEILTAAWDFFQQQVLGMQWMNGLIEDLLTACGLDTGSKLGGSIQFFIYDTIKILILLGVLIFIISYIQSFFPPERTKTILGRFHGIRANTCLLDTSRFSRQLGNIRAIHYRTHTSMRCRVCNPLSTVLIDHTRVPISGRRRQEPVSHHFPADIRPCQNREI